MQYDLDILEHLVHSETKYNFIRKNIILLYIYYKFNNINQINNYITTLGNFNPRRHILELLQDIPKLTTLFKFKENEIRNDNKSGVDRKNFLNFIHSKRAPIHSGGASRIKRYFNVLANTTKGNVWSAHI